MYSLERACFCYDLYMYNRDLVHKAENGGSCYLLNVIDLIQSRHNQWFTIQLLQSMVEFNHYLVNDHVRISGQI